MEKKLKKAIKMLKEVERELINTGAGPNEWIGKLQNKVSKTIKELTNHL